MRILRVIRQSRGNSLLIGLAGLGKSTLTKLSAFITEVDLKPLDVGNNFNKEKFEEWLRKEILLCCAGPDCGLDGKPLCLLVTDS